MIKYHTESLWRVGEAHGERPAHLMREGFSQRLPGIYDANRIRDQLDAVAMGRDAMAELVVVHEMIDQAFEAADFRKMFFRRGHRGAQGEIHAGCQPGANDARGEIRRVPDGFALGGERTVRQAAVEAGDPAALRVAD